MDETEVLAVIRASPARRLIGVAAVAGLGVLVVYTAFARPPGAFGWQAFLLIFGVFALWLADRMRRATALSVELTREGLRTSDGEAIAGLGEIETLDRGVFAFKPSNGFLLTLREKAPRRWQPGLWWRLGRRVGIGGVVPRAQTKVMAEIIEALVAERGGA